MPSILVFDAPDVIGAPADDVPLSAAFGIVILFIIINTSMKLDWYHNQAEGFIYCNIDNITYKSYNGGDTIIKLIDNNQVSTMEKHDPADPWEVEKQWISDTYSDRFGVYEPMDAGEVGMQQWFNDHPEYTAAFPAFGLYNENYLDRLQRSSDVQVGNDMHTLIFDPEQRLYIEWDKDNTGKFYRREWCEEDNGFYNVQPCCVFPNNPGRTELSDEEKQSLISEHGMDLSTI